MAEHRRHMYMYLRRAIKNERRFDTMMFYCSTLFGAIFGLGVAIILKLAK